MSTPTDQDLPPLGEPWTVDAPARPGHAHVVELLDQNGTTVGVYEVDPSGDGYTSTDPRLSYRRPGPRTWQHLLGLGWEAGWQVRVCPLGYARHAQFGAVRVRALERGDSPYGEEVVIAGPVPDIPGGDHPRRWVSLTSPGGRYSDDEVDRPPWRALARDEAYTRLLARDPR